MRQQHTVIMIQVARERSGHDGDTRDRSPVADKAYAAPVPKELMDYLQQHKDTLIPEFRQVWESAAPKPPAPGKKCSAKASPLTKSSWPGSMRVTSAGVVDAGKAEYPIPMNVNAALPRTSTIADLAARVANPAEQGTSSPSAAPWTT